MNTHYKLSFLLALILITILCLPAFNTGHVESSPDEAGTVALIGDDWNVYLYEVATDTLTAITTEGGTRRAYLWPTWSTDGQLAYFGISREQDNFFNFGVFVRPHPFSDEVVHFYSTRNDNFTYAYWAPADCPATNCRDLAILYTNPRGQLAVRRLRSFAQEFQVDEVAQGGPFYWDWSPDGQTMFWARNGASLELYDVAEESVIKEFEERQGLQRAVDWSPVDNRLLSAVRNANGSSRLVIFDEDERITLLDNIRTGLSFGWSPDATRIAYLEQNRGRLGIIDVASGQVVATPSEQILAFAWSPFGDKLAYLGVIRPGADVNARPSGQQGTDVYLAWYVYDVATEESRRVAQFLPTAQMIYYFRFFDQFVQSHALWSPNGHHLVYAEILGSGRSVVSLVDVTQDSPQPVEIRDGTFGVFSWQ